MGKIDIQINNRTYPMACDDGQEEQLLSLAGKVDERVKMFKPSVGSISDIQLLVMTSLFMADEIEELKRNSKAASSNKQDAPSADFENAFTDAINKVAMKVESMAVKLAKA